MFFMEKEKELYYFELSLHASRKKGLWIMIIQNMRGLVLEKELKLNHSNHSK